MAKLIYGTIASLDGYIADEQGNFEWGEPGDEVHAFVNDLEGRIGTYLYGRKMYEVMVYWETADQQPDQSKVERDYTELWKAAEKIVFSKTLENVASERTRIERDFDPDAIRKMKEIADRDISVSGPELAAQALKAGLVDEFHVFIAPIIVGGGNRALPDHVTLELELLDERRFANGMVYLHYSIKN
jgi:dihydrofolate reductase